MAIGVIGRKAGMTRIFTPDRASVPVTVIEVEPNRVVQLRSQENDGYRAVQVTIGQRKVSRVSKPLAGHFAKARITVWSMLSSFSVSVDPPFTSPSRANRRSASAARPRNLARSPRRAQTSAPARRILRRTPQ